jgi:hypothetical protein
MRALRLSLQLRNRSTKPSQHAAARGQSSKLTPLPPFSDGHRHCHILLLTLILRSLPLPADLGHLTFAPFPSAQT